MSQLDKNTIVAEIRSFPAIPVVAARLLTLLENPDTSAAMIEDTIREDPGITANVLRLANSAYFGLSSKVGSIRQAVTLLGWRRLVQLVTASCVSAVVDAPVSGYGLESGELHRHSIGVSVAAEGLLNELKLPAAQEIFTAALLHDIGKLILDRYVGDTIKDIEAETENGTPFEVAEQLVLGVDHAEVGAMVLEKWSFPKRIIGAVRWHHDPEGADTPDEIIDVVHVANVLCLMIGIGLGKGELKHEPSPDAVKRIGLKPHHLEAVASRTLAWVAELSEALGRMET